MKKVTGNDENILGNISSPLMIKIDGCGNRLIEYLHIWDIFFFRVK